VDDDYTKHIIRLDDYHDNVDDLIEQDEGLPLMVEKKMKGEKYDREKRKRNNTK